MHTKAPCAVPYFALFPDSQLWEVRTCHYVDAILCGRLLQV